MQLMEQRLGLLQIDRVEAFSEPVIKRSEKIVGLLPLARSKHVQKRAASCIFAVRNPITGIAGCCALAASGHTAALPSPAMNARLFIE